MTKTLRVFFAAALLAAPAAHAESIKADFPREIAAQCATKWPNSPQLRGRCIDQQTAAAFAIIRAYRDAKRTASRDVIAQCLRQWRRSPLVTQNSFNYRAAKQCADNQLATTRF